MLTCDTRKCAHGVLHYLSAAQTVGQFVTVQSAEKPGGRCLIRASQFPEVLGLKPADFQFNGNESIEPAMEEQEVERKIPVPLPELGTRNR